MVGNLFKFHEPFMAVARVSASRTVVENPIVELLLQGTHIEGTLYLSCTFIVLTTKKRVGFAVCSMSAASGAPRTFWLYDLST